MALDSEGSDIEVEAMASGLDLDDEIGPDPLERVQLDSEMDYMFDSDDDDDEFVGFQSDWVLDPERFTPQRKIPDFRLNPGSKEQHPEEMTALAYFKLFWDEEVSLLLSLLHVFVFSSEFL